MLLTDLNAGIAAAMIQLMFDGNSDESDYWVIDEDDGGQ